MSLTSKIKDDEEFNNILDIFNYDEMLNEINKYNYKDLKIERKLSNINLYAFLGTTFDYMCRFILQKFEKYKLILFFAIVILGLLYRILGQNLFVMYVV